MGKEWEIGQDDKKSKVASQSNYCVCILCDAALVLLLNHVKPSRVVCIANNIGDMDTFEYLAYGHVIVTKVLVSIHAFSGTLSEEV